MPPPIALTYWRLDITQLACYARSMKQIYGLLSLMLLWLAPSGADATPPWQVKLLPASRQHAYAWPAFIDKKFKLRGTTWHTATVSQHLSTHHWRHRYTLQLAILRHAQQRLYLLLFQQCDDDGNPYARSRFIDHLQLRIDASEHQLPLAINAGYHGQGSAFCQILLYRLSQGDIYAIAHAQTQISLQPSSPSPADDQAAHRHQSAESLTIQAERLRLLQKELRTQLLAKESLASFG